MIQPALLFPLSLLADLALAADEKLSVPAPTSPEATAPAPAAPGPDRSAPPPVKDTPLLDHAEPEVHALGPGVEAWHIQAPGARKVAVHVVFGRGMYEWGGKPTLPNRALGALADVAAGDLSGAELSTERDLHEIDLWSTLRLHDGEVSLLVPKDKLARGLELQELVLREPSFPKKDVKRWILDQQLYYTVEGPASQAAVANAAMSFAWFPADHPYGLRPDLSELSQVKRKSLLQGWQDLLANVPLTVITVGDLPWSEMEGPITALVAGLGREVARGEGLQVAAPTQSRVIAVDMPGQAQVALRLRLAAPTRDHADTPAMMASNFVLGGYFLSRLNRNLREEKGFTYGAGSQYAYTETYGSVTVTVDVKSENVAETISEIEKELAGLYAEPVQAEPVQAEPVQAEPAQAEPAQAEAPVDPLVAELLAAKRSHEASWNRVFESAGSAVSFYRSLLRLEQTVGEARAVVEAIGAVTPADVRRVSKQWLGPDAARVWVVVGDRKALEEQLAKAGLTDQEGLRVQWVTPAEAILGKF